MFYSSHPLKTTGSLEVGLCFNLREHTYTVPHITILQWSSLDHRICSGQVTRSARNEAQPWKSPSWPWYIPPCQLSSRAGWILVTILDSHSYLHSIASYPYWLSEASLTLFQYITPCTSQICLPINRYHFCRRQVGIAGLSVISLGRQRGIRKRTLLVCQDAKLEA